MVLFGSRASGVQGPDSDIDLLCVGCDVRGNFPNCEIQWISEADIVREDWLGSELANHIAHFGVWLHGSDTWSARVFISDAALKLKRRAIASRIRALNRCWSVLTDPFRWHHLTLLRRDIQRYHLMATGRPVPPTHFLDVSEEMKRGNELGTALSRRGSRHSDRPAKFNRVNAHSPSKHRREMADVANFGRDLDQSALSSADELLREFPVGEQQ
jgi:hypothetical protein